MEKTKAIILAAGLGKRMGGNIPKVMHKIADKPMINIIISVLESLSIKDITAVIGEGFKELEALVYPYKISVQKERLGTGHAVQTAWQNEADFDGNVLVLFGDSPMIKAKTLECLIDEHTRHNNAVTVLGFESDNPGQYGRLLIKDNNLNKIIEFKDANSKEKAITLCNSGIMCISGKDISSLLKELDNNNAAKEYYLTQIVDIANNKRLKCGVMIAADEKEMLGANTFAELMVLEGIMQNRLKIEALSSGVKLLSPENIFLSYDAKLEDGSIIEPYVIIKGDTQIGKDVHIKAFSYIEDAKVEKGAIIGPFARLRPEARIGQDVHIGNFVEIKKSNIEKGAKVNHLSYIGDASIGEKTNIGAGTITCNYDGFSKHKTTIGSNAFVGSNTCFIAPVTMGDGAITGAGSVITKDISKDSLAVSRARQEEKQGFAIKYKEKRNKK